jgi:transcriptional regulator with XRE-family HTH domain
MEFHNILKYLRKEKGLTQKQLSENIGFSRSVIGYWENGQKQPTLDALKALVKFFGVTMDYLTGLE